MYTYIKSIAQYPVKVRLFLLTELLLGLELGIWNLNLNFFLLDKGLLKSEIGAIAAVGSLTTALFSLAAGSFCDRYGFRRMMYLGCFIRAAGMFTTIFSFAPWVLYAGRIITGFADSLMLASTYPFISGMVPHRDKNTVCNLLYSFTLLSIFLGNISGGLLLKYHYGRVNPYVFSLVLSAVLMITLGLCRFFLPETAQDKKSTGKRLYLTGQKFVLFFLLFDFIGYTEHFLAFSMINLIYRDYMGIPEWAVGTVAGISTLMSGLASFITPPLITKSGRKRLTTLVLVLLTLTYHVMAVQGGKRFVLLAVFGTLLSNMLVGLLYGPILNRIPEGEKGRYSGLKQLLNSIGAALGSGLTGFLLSFTGQYAWIYTFAFFLALLELLIYFYGFRNSLEEPPAAGG